MAESMMLNLDMGKSKNPYLTETTLEPSKGPTEEEREISLQLSMSVSNEVLKKHGFMKMNFDVKKKWNCFMVNGITIVKESGETFYIPIRYKLRSGGNRYSSSLRKVGAYLMPGGIPTSFQLYAQEINETYKNDWLWKLLIGSSLGFLFSWLGVGVINVLSALVIAAIVDGFLSLIPGNVKTDTESDHKLTVKGWALVTNVTVIIGAIKSHEYLNVYALQHGGLNWVAWIGVNFHYLVLAYIFYAYAKRIFVYVVRANKVGAPAYLKAMFTKFSKK